MMPGNWVTDQASPRRFAQGTSSSFRAMERSAIRAPRNPSLGLRGGAPARGELASNAWVLNPHGCGARQLLESAFLQRGLPFVSAVEAEGYELQFSLISEGVRLGLVMPQVLRSSVLWKHIKPVAVKGLSLMQN